LYITVIYKIASFEKPHLIGESFMLPAAIDMVKIMLGESYAKGISKIPLGDNSVGRISHISEHLFDPLID
jgi:hypothetical protein